MTFRNDLDAAHARLTAVDRENADLRDEVETLGAEVERLRAAKNAPAPAPPAEAPAPRRSWRFLLWWLPAWAATLVGAALMLRYGHDVAATVLALVVCTALRVAMKKRLG